MLTLLRRQQYLGQFYGEHSPYSGLVVDGAVGLFSQGIRFGLDFTSTRSILFLQETCPPFVSCYEDAGTVSGSTVHHLWMGSMISDYVRFYHVSAPVLSMDLHDVGGTLGMGPGSLLLSHSLVEVEEMSDFGVMFRQRRRSSDLVLDAVISSSSSRWEFVNSSLLLRERELGIADVCIVFDPTVSWLIVPVSFKGTFMHNLGLVESGNRFYPAKESADIIEVVLAGRIRVKLSSSSLIDDRNDPPHAMIKFRDCDWFVIGVAPNVFPNPSVAF